VFHEEDRTRELDERGAALPEVAGGKRSMLRYLLPLVPPNFGTYYEPFVGGGAMFFGLYPERAVLSDSNAELINAYTVVRDDVGALITELGKHRYEEAYYYAIRAKDPGRLPPAEARIIFLNRTCFNGLYQVCISLYRVNRRGEFNVPFGEYTNPVICDAENLRACSTALEGVTIECTFFQTVLTRAVAGDFVYFDPPYHPLSKTSSFRSYTADGFTLAD
jgi:DNA adenine methylase